MKGLHHRRHHGQGPRCVDPHSTHDVLGPSILKRPSPCSRGLSWARPSEFPALPCGRSACCSGTRLSSSWSTRARQAKPRCRSGRTAGEPPTSPFASMTSSRRRLRSRRKGIEFYGAVKRRRRRVCWPDGGGCTFNDPDGYPLELVEVAYYNTESGAPGIAAYLRVANLDDQSARAAGSRGHPSSERRRPSSIRPWSTA